MGVKPARDLGPYPANCKDASWKVAKTDKARDKWRTNVGAALRKAADAYDKVEIEKLDLGLLVQKDPNLNLDSPDNVEIIMKIAIKHNKKEAEAARKALDAAIKSCNLSAKNPIISPESRAKAKQIAKDLAPRLAQLKSFTTDDFRRKYHSALKTEREEKQKRLLELQKQLKNQKAKPTGDRVLNLKNVK